MSISHTTRQRRGGEVDGEDYYFVENSDFLRMVDQGLFLEYAEVYGNYYGTSRIAVETMLTKGYNVLLDIDWQGARSVQEQMPNAVSISVLPPSVEELERRLRCRGSDSQDVIRSRMQLALDEMQHCRDADFVVLNDNFNEALDDLSLILKGESGKLRALSVDLEKLLGTPLGTSLSAEGSQQQDSPS